MLTTLITLPCTAQELENALHAVCDCHGLWDARIRPVFVKPQGYYYLEFYDIETEVKVEEK